MATKNSKPAGRKIADTEVKDSYHDEVLNWLIDNIESLISATFDMEEEEVNSQLSKAKEKFNDLMRNTVTRELDRLLKDKVVSIYSHLETELDKATLLKLEDAKKHIEPAIKVCARLKLGSSEGEAAIQSYEVMKRVAYLETKQERGSYRETTKEIPAGYVDLFAEVFVPNGFAIMLEGLGFNEQSSSISLYDVKCCARLAESIKSKELRAIKIGEKRNLFFSVRTGPFTLGEVLQELKELRELEDQQQNVVLVVDNIDPSMRSKIEREGFMVIARCDHH